MGESRFDLIVIGAGVGKSVAESMADAGWSVAMVERERVGGGCPFVACMPAKAMLRSASVRRLVGRAHELGALAHPAVLDDPRRAWKAAVERRDDIVDHRHDEGHARSMTDKGVTLIRGEAQITAADAIEVDGVSYRFGELVIATGSSPTIPSIDGLASIDCWTSDQALSTDCLPSSMAVLGGGPVGCELAQLFAGFDCRVTVIEAADQLLPGEDPDRARELANALTDHGVEVVTDVEVDRVERRADEAALLAHGREFDRGRSGHRRRRSHTELRCGARSARRGAGRRRCRPN